MTKPAHDVAHDKEADNQNVITTNSISVDRLVQDLDKLCPSLGQAVAKLLVVLGDGEKDISSIMNEVGESSRRTYVRKSIQPALDAALIEMTLPDKPTSPYQKYRLTDKGKQLIQQVKNLKR